MSVETLTPQSQCFSGLTCSSAVHLDLTLAGLQPAARHAAQVGGEVPHWRQVPRPNAVTVSGVTLTHNGIMAKVSGNTIGASWMKKYHIY